VEVVVGRPAQRVQQGGQQLPAPQLHGHPSLGIRFEGGQAVVGLGLVLQQLGVICDKPCSVQLEGEEAKEEERRCG